MRCRPLSLAGLLLASATLPAGGQPAAPAPDRNQARLEPVAETRLLMEGLALPNFRGAEKLLRQKPDSTEAWKFARGQALLVAETANLLLLRPPRNSQARLAWFARATELRDASRELARSIAAENFPRSRVNLVSLANVCNRCHRAFRVAVEIVPFETPAQER